MMPGLAKGYVFIEKKLCLGYWELIGRPVNARLYTISDPFDEEQEAPSDAPARPGPTAIAGGGEIN